MDVITVVILVMLYVIIKIITVMTSVCNFKNNSVQTHYHEPSNIKCDLIYYEN